MNRPPDELLEALLDGVLVVDAASLQVVAANRQAAALLGSSVAELRGSAAPALLAHTPEDIAFWDGAAAGRGDAIESDTLLRRADGHTLPVTRRVTPVRGGNGRPQWIVALRDRRAELLAQHGLEQALVELQATLESIAEGILVTDNDGGIRRCNRRFAALWGLPEALLDHRDDDAVLDGMRARVADPAGWMRGLAEADDPARLPAAHRIVLHSGRTLERVIQPLLSHGRVLGRVHSFRDVFDMRPDRRLAGAA